MLNKIFEAIQKIKNRSPKYQCPHCGKDIVFEFEFEHDHKFNTQVETTNKISKTKIEKA
jgi:hypothetical protein